MALARPPEASAPSAATAPSRAGLPEPLPGGPELGAPAIDHPAPPDGARPSWSTQLSTTARGTPVSRVSPHPRPPLSWPTANAPSRKAACPAPPPLLPAAIFLFPRRLLLTPWPAPRPCSRGTGAARREGSSRRLAGLGLGRPRATLSPPGRVPTQKLADAARPVSGGREALRPAAWAASPQAPTGVRERRRRRRRRFPGPASLGTRLPIHRPRRSP